MKTRTSQIIVADDDKTVRTVIVQALSRQGYQVGAATTIAGLWDITTSGRGDVLITDVGFQMGMRWNYCRDYKKNVQILPLLL